MPRFPNPAWMILIPLAASAAGAAEYRYSIQLGEPGVVVRTDRETGATTLCRATAKGVWCPPSEAECRKLLDQAESWQAEHSLPDQQQVIDCLQHDRCDTRPQKPPPGALTGVDETTLSWCLEH